MTLTWAIKQTDQVTRGLLKVKSWAQRYWGGRRRDDGATHLVMRRWSSCGARLFFGAFVCGLSAGIAPLDDSFSDSIRTAGSTALGRLREFGTLNSSH